MLPQLDVESMIELGLDVDSQRKGYFSSVDSRVRQIQQALNDIKDSMYDLSRREEDEEEGSKDQSTDNVMINGVPWKELQKSIFNIKFNFEGFYDKLSKKDKATMQELMNRQSEARANSKAKNKKSRNDENSNPQVSQKQKKIGYPDEKTRDNLRRIHGKQVFTIESIRQAHE